MLGVAFSRVKRIEMTSSFIKEFNAITNESNPLAVSLLCHISPYYIFPLPDEKMNNSFIIVENLMQEYLTNYIQPYLKDKDNLKTSPKLIKEVLATEEGFAILRLNQALIRSGGPTSPISRIYPTILPTLNDQMFAEASIVALHTPEPKFVKKYLREAEKRLNQGMDFHYIVSALQDLSKLTRKKEFEMVYDLESMPQVSVLEWAPA